MAFISEVHKSRGGGGRRPHQNPAAVRFRKTPSGSGGGTMTNGVPFRAMKIDIQIEEESRSIRINRDDKGVSCGKNGTFSCSLEIYKIVGSEPIPLYEGGDGWWYGKY